MPAVQIFLHEKQSYVLCAKSIPGSNSDDWSYAHSILRIPSGMVRDWMLIEMVQTPANDTILQVFGPFQLAQLNQSSADFV
jgi:hypothetical protein